MLRQIRNQQLKLLAPNEAHCSSPAGFCLKYGPSDFQGLKSTLLGYRSLAVAVIVLVMAVAEVLVVVIIVGVAVAGAVVVKAVKHRYSSGNGNSNSPVYVVMAQCHVMQQHSNSKSVHQIVVW